MKTVSCFFVICSSVLLASPEGMRAVHGEVVEEPGTIHTNQEKTILEWDRFSISGGESLHFNQPSQTSSVLNRVMGEAASEIHGLLSSNGALYLLNPNGILIGPEGRIDTAGFIASSLDMLNEDFLSDKHAFREPGHGEIVNFGTVHCASGNVALIGRKVQNEGSLQAPNGYVGLGVGQEIFLQLKDHPYMLIRATLLGKEEEEGASISHSGLIQALKAELRTGSTAYQKAIQSTGIIDALSIEQRNGEIYLVADKGICEVSNRLNAPGGTVHVLSDLVGVLDGADIDVSSNTGGGTILVGGDFRGENPDVPNAYCGFVGAKARLNADGLEKGSGGKIVCWSDHTMRFYGTLYARGGSQGGDGGNVEVSGKERLIYEGTSDLTASHGVFGTLLLDPNTVTISTGLDSGTSMPACPSTSYVASAGANVINTTTLQNHLASCNLTIDTGAGALNNITVSNTVSWSANTTLSLIADGLIFVNASVTNTSASTGTTVIRMQANGNDSTTTSNTNRGILITGATIQTTGQNIEIYGSAPRPPGDSSNHLNRGVELASASQIITTNGSILIKGTGGTGSGQQAVYNADDQGIYINTGNTIGVLGSGTITLYGQGGIPNIAASYGPTDCEGVYLLGTVSCANNTGGTGITIVGTGANTPTNYGGGEMVNPGIWLSGSLTITGNSNNFLYGKGGDTPFSYSQDGINVSGATITNSGGGNLTIVGTGGVGSSGGANNGIKWSGSTCTATGGGSITLSGSANATSGPSSSGIWFNNAGTFGGGTTTGNLFLYGLSNSTNTSALGVRVSTGRVIQTSSGNITIVGTGSSGGSGAASHGVYFTGASSAQLLTATGAVTVNGIAGAGSRGIKVDSSATISATGAGSISFNNVSTTQNIELGATTWSFASGSSFACGGPVILSANQTISTSGAGNLSFNNTIDGAQTLSLTVATGAITFGGAVGGTTRLTSLTLSGASGTLNLGANISLNNSSFAPPMPTILTGSSTINTGATGGAITFSGTLNGASAGSQNLTLQAGNGIVTFGTTIGATTPIGALTVSTTDNTAASGWKIGGNISCTSLTSTGVTNKITLTAGSTITASTGSISFGTSTTAVDGAQALSLFATTAAQSVTLAGAIGSNTALTSLTVNSPTITQSSTVRTSSNVSYTASTAVQLGGNITTTLPGSISFTTPTTNLTAGVSLDTTNAGNNNGAAISFSGAINNAQALTLRAGSSGAITFGGAVGTSGTPLSSITFTTTAGSSLSLGGNVFLNNSAFAPGMPVNLANSVTINTGATGGAITFSGALNGASAGSQNLTLQAGNGVVTFGSAVGATTALGVLNVQSGSSLVVQASINCSTGTWAPPMTITDVINVTTQ